MSNPVQDQDEDIIILWDTDDGLDIENSDILSNQWEKKEEILWNSEGILSQNNETSIPLVSPITEVSKEDNLFNFGIDESKTESIQEVSSSIKTNEESIFPWFNLDTEKQNQVVLDQEQWKEELIQAQTPVQKSVVDFLQEEAKQQENNLSFPPISETDTSSSSWTSAIQSDDDSSDMNAILQATIQKLKKRQEDIWQEKAEKITQIDTRNEKIKFLKEEVNDLKDNVESLDTENQKIEANIIALEKMKLGEVNSLESVDPVKKRVARTKAV